MHFSSCILRVFANNQPSFLRGHLHSLLVMRLFVWASSPTRVYIFSECIHLCVFKYATRDIYIYLVSLMLVCVKSCVYIHVSKCARRRVYILTHTQTFLRVKLELGVSLWCCLVIILWVVLFFRFSLFIQWLIISVVIS